jgi:hypothetical protein
MKDGLATVTTRRAGTSSVFADLRRSRRGVVMNSCTLVNETDGAVRA